ncbi:ABC-three component system protein [Glycomyces arizonensis]|uniref:ABC-three component system protein n=1 Tax=Glycomyces arizonensis TaxID=256035 RepID=UPI0012EB2A6E|nr:ABC-three component system protein [Glycomyces arizonensis]
MNLIVAERTQRSQSTDSRNGTGKTSLIEVLHFLLGANAAKHLCSREVFRSMVFSLTLDWSTPGGALEVRRRGGAKRVQIAPPLEGREFHGITGLDDWKSALQRELYPQSLDVEGLSVRNLLSYAIRRERDGGFQDPLKFSTKAIKQTVFSTHLAYLLGLDAKLIDQYRALAEKQSSVTALKQALKGLDLGEVVGDQATIEGRARLLGHEIEQLQGQIAQFQVIPEFERLKNQADELTTEIERLAREDEIDQRNEADIHDSLERERHPSDDYLPTAFQELGVALPREVQRRYDEVEQFHRVIADNRQRFLRDELQETRRRIEQRRRRREECDEERSVILRRLNQGGALQGLQMLQHSLASKEEQLRSLREQTDLLDRIRNIQDEVQRELLELKRRAHDDLRTRDTYISEASHLFTDYARRIYSDSREAFLTIKEGAKNLEIRPHIENDESNGIGNMRMLCFDLVCTVMAHRGGRGPDFLVHDGRLFDGVDQRQVAFGLRLAAEVAEAEGLQYIVPINSDVLDKGREWGFNPDPYLLKPRLTDADESGGLFGFRFD